MPECRCGCGRPAVRRTSGLAEPCYFRWHRHGRPDTVPPPGATRRDRIEDYLELRSWGLTRKQSASRLGVSERTIWRYERDLAKAGVICA